MHNTNSGKTMAKVDLVKFRKSIAVKGWPIKAAIASAVISSMLLVAIVIITLGYRSERESMLTFTNKIAGDAGQLIEQKALRILEPAQVALRLLSGTSLVEAGTLEQRLDRVRQAMDVLAASSVSSAVFVGYTDGSFLLVRALGAPGLRKQFDAPEGAHYLVQSVEVKPGGEKVGQHVFYDGTRAFIERRIKADYVFDPRARPWFVGAASSQNLHASEPYVFFTTQQVGITLSQSSHDRRAVFGIDIVLDDLARSLSELKITSNSQMALVNGAGAVLAFSGAGIAAAQGQGRVGLPTLQQLQAPSLLVVGESKARSASVSAFKIGGQEWMGVSFPFEALKGRGNRFLVAIPGDDLLGDIKAKRRQLIFLLAGLTALLMPLGWWAAANVGKSLDKLTEHAIHMGRFDFDQPKVPDTVVREPNMLAHVMNDMGKTIKTFLQISQDMATEPKVEQMLDNVLYQMVTATRCAAGAVYLRDGAEAALKRSCFKGDFLSVSEPHLAHDTRRKAPISQREIAAGKSELQVELRGRKGALEGLLVLQHATDDAHADPAFQEFVSKLSGMLAVSIETRQFVEAQKNLLDAFIRVMADAIDAKSPYTGGHCERVPVLAGMLIDRLAREKEPPYVSFSMTEDERYEFHLGAWLHDCGKVTSPEHILDKSSKLEVIYNRIHEVRMRFEVLWRDAELDCWQAVAAGGKTPAQTQALIQARDERQRVLQDDFEFVCRCNLGGEYMPDADVARLESIGKTTWLRHFDNRLGLSDEESRRMGAQGAVALPAREPLLADRPEHLIPWGGRKPSVERGDPKNAFGFDMNLPAHFQNMGELHNLATRKGTLTEEDRFRINDHIVQTLVMLRNLPWPAHLAKVPDIAASHHEKMDGTGYPRRLPAEQLTLPDRVMALADIFEALTAADRPYKTPKTLTESLKIMALMAKDGHIDADLFRYFLKSNLWQEFARRFLREAQIDPVNVAAIEQLLPSQSHDIAQNAP